MVMVMETPSPQSVGREFVRQYYTMLHDAPLHLHRFYSTNSSFVHGGIERPGQETEPVYGQQEIHKKIMQLNFRDCHAKILQVDSHATMGDGVVVQVTGELSNNGQPMRRFMQTFVLALQSPKRYYVHNDIFRYQDEVFQDDDDNEVAEGVVESETEEETPEVVDASESVPDNNTYFDQQGVSNGSAHMEEIAAMTAANIQPAVVSHVPATTPPSSLVEQDEAEMDKLEPTSDNDFGFNEKVQTKSPEPTDERLQGPEPPDSPSEPKTYANMVSKNASSASSGSTGSGSGTSWHTATTTKHSSTPPISNMPTMPTSLRMDNSKSDGFMSSPNNAQPHRMPARSRGGSMRGSGNMRDRGPMRNSEDSADGDRRRSTNQFPDQQQLFVGNLPLTISEDDLKEQFSQFGNVIDIRINNRPHNKPGPRVPNFGFVVFDHADSVHKALDAKPIMFNGEHRLNVEEKKSKPRDGARLGGGDGRPNTGRGGGIGRPGMGPSRGSGRGGPGGLNRSEGRGGGGNNMGNRGGFGQGTRR